MVESAVYYTQRNGFLYDTIPILFTNKHYYNNHTLWSMIVNNTRNLTPLMCAAFNINYDRITFLLNIGANVNIVDSSNQSSLLYAITKIKEIPKDCSKCDTCTTKMITIIKIIKKLCQYNPNLNILTSGLDNIVMIAIKLGFTEAVNIFCNYNFNINQVNDEGKTAMSIAIEHNYPIISYLLWKKGADINSIDDKKHTFLMTMVYNYDSSVTYEMVEDVLKHKPNINAQDVNNATALSYACVEASLKVMDLLIKYGADVNQSLVSMIHLNKIDYINILCAPQNIVKYDFMINFAKKLKNKEIEILLLQKLKEFNKFNRQTIHQKM